jgi:ankyrin repeat protein
LTYLVEQGADVNLGNNDGSTPLHCLVRHGQIPLLRILVEQGKADIHQADLSGRTPLDDAAINMMSEAAAYLWEHGAEPSMKSEHKTAVVCCRPLSLNTPPARANAAVCGVGSKLYVFGGYGVPSEYIVDDPMNRLPEEIGCELLGDFTMIDLDDVEMGGSSNKS